MTEIEFLKGIRYCIAKVVAAREGRGTMSVNHAIIDAVMTFFHFNERFTGATRGSSAILKPLLVIALRSSRPVDQTLCDVLRAIDILSEELGNGSSVSDGMKKYERKRLIDLVTHGVYDAPRETIGAPTHTVLAPSVAIATGESNV